LDPLRSFLKIKIATYKKLSKKKRVQMMINGKTISFLYFYEVIEANTIIHVGLALQENLLIHM